METIMYKMGKQQSPTVINYNGKEHEKRMRILCSITESLYCAAETNTIL